MIDRDNTDSTTKNTLVAFFSHSGNTRQLAISIHELTGGDIHEIMPVKSYPSDYDAVLAQAKKELNNNVLPELTSRVDNMAAYDVVYLGFPNWWGTLPRPVVTMLKSYQMNGKTIVPFCTHGGGGLGHSVEDIKRLCPDSIVMQGLAVNGSQAGRAQIDIMAWLSLVNQES